MQQGKEVGSTVRWQRQLEGGVGVAVVGHRGKASQTGISAAQAVFSSVTTQGITCTPDRAKNGKANWRCGAKLQYHCHCCRHSLAAPVEHQGAVLVHFE